MVVSEVVAAVATDTASAKYQLNAKDLKSAGMLLFDTAIGSILTVLSDQIIPGINWGIWAPVVIPVSSMVIRTIRKYISDGGVPIADQKK